MVDYQKLFEALPGRYLAILPNDPLFTLVAESDEHEKVALRKREDILGKPFFDVFPDTTDKFVKTGVSDLAESLRTVIRTKAAHTMDTLRYDIPNEQGALVERYWQATHYPLLNAAGEVELIFQNTADITEHVLAEQQRTVVEQQLSQALSVGFFGAWNWDIKKDVVIADKNLSAVFGVSAQDGAAGLPLDVFIHSIYEADRNAVQSAIGQAIKTGSAYEQEYRTVTADGSIHWVLARGVVNLDKTGAPATFPGVIVDITEQKQDQVNAQVLADASQVLLNSFGAHDTLQKIAEAVVPDLADWCAIDMLQDDGSIEQVVLVHSDPAKVAWALRHRKKLSTISRSGVSNVIKNGTSVMHPVITEAMLEAGTDDPAELALLKKLGVTSTIIAPIMLDDAAIGTITLVSSETHHTYTDNDHTAATGLANRVSLAIANGRLLSQLRNELAARARLQDELEQRVAERTLQFESANQELMRSNQELQDFAYVASHDLQEPLRKIQAFGNLLEEEHGETLGEGRDYLRRMRSAAARMSVLIEDLLSFSRVTTKAQPYVAVDLSKVAHEVIDDLEMRISDTQGTVTIGKLPEIEADPVQMHQLFQNLIGNALKFHKPDVAPKVVVKAIKKGATIRITVTDNGIGFDEKYTDRIFAVFQRLHGRDQYEGTGIGLAVCRKIVERHNGTIMATSSPGNGAQFTISLPTTQQGVTNS